MKKSYIIIGVFILLATALAGGWVWYGEKWEEKDDTVQSGQKQEEQSDTKPENIENLSQWSIDHEEATKEQKANTIKLYENVSENLKNGKLVQYKIPELGIQINLPKDTADDLIYAYKESPAKRMKDGKEITEGITKTANLSTKTLVSIDEDGCSPENHPTGGITREEGKQSDYGDLWSGRVPIVPFNSFFVYYDGPQSPCTFSKEAYSDDYEGVWILYYIFLPEIYGLNEEEWHKNVQILQEK